MLRPSRNGIQSNATPSIPSPVTNLTEHAPSLGWDQLLEAVAQQYDRGAALFLLFVLQTDVERLADGLMYFCFVPTLILRVWTLLRVHHRRPVQRVLVSWCGQHDCGAAQLGVDVW